MNSKGLDPKHDELGGMKVDTCDRRSMIRKALKAGGVAYVAPMVLASARPALAQISGPNPGCTGAVCGNFINCSNLGAGCVCFTTSTGGGLCANGNISCSSFTQCGPSPTFTCPAGNICVVNSCCGVPICYLPVNFCGGGGGTNRPPVGGVHGSAGLA